jgi:hypothetical protein
MNIVVVVVAVVLVVIVVIAAVLLLRGIGASPQQEYRRNLRSIRRIREDVRPDRIGPDNPDSTAGLGGLL